MAHAELRVGGITPLTTIDYPDVLAMVVFCQGCPWRCSYCHNPELLSPRSTIPIPWDEVLAFMERRHDLLDAVVFSGGEPTLQPALEGALTAARNLGFKTGLHSAGIYPTRLARLLPRLDWVGLDVKALPDDYPALTGVKGSGKPAWESVKLLIDSGIPHELRLTVHPGITSHSQVDEIIARLRAMGAERVREQTCRDNGRLSASLATTPCPAAAWHHERDQRAVPVHPPRRGHALQLRHSGDTTDH